MNESKKVILHELIASTMRFNDYMTEYAKKEAPIELSDNHWNCDQIIQHVIAIDQSIMELLQIPFRKKKLSHFSKYEIRNMMLNRKKKFDSPIDHPMVAAGTKSIDEWLMLFKVQRTSLIEQVQDDIIDLESLDAFPHIRIGNLTKRDWLFVLSYHSDRHIAQAKELLFCV